MIPLPSRVTLLALLGFLYLDGFQPVFAGSIFHGNAVPGFTSNTTTPHELGTRFTTTRAGTITHARVFSSATEGFGFHTITLWRDDSSAVPLAGPYYRQYGGENAWVTLDIPDLAIPAGNYIIAVSTTTQSPSGGYPYTQNYWSTVDTASPFLKVTAAAGVFTTDIGTRPTLVYANTSYFRDVVFVVPAEFKVTYRDITIADEDLSPERLGGTDFGNIVVGAYGAQFSYRLENPGSPGITLTGTPHVTITGNNANQFVVVDQPIGTIDPESSNNGFTIAFRPTSAGYKYAEVNIAHSLNAKPHRFRIAGHGRTPDPNAQNLFQPGEPDYYVGFGTTVPLELGTRFSSFSDGIITHVRLYKCREESGIQQVSIWNEATNTRIFGPFPITTTADQYGWFTFDIPDVSVNKSTAYILSITTGTDANRCYAAINNYFEQDGTNGLDLYYPESAGVFTDNMGTMPTQVFANTSYFRDIVFRIPDTDNDGFNDQTEALYGTSITDGHSTPRLTLTPLPNGDYKLLSPALPSKELRDFDVNYTLESSTTLAPYSWKFVETNRTGDWMTPLSPAPAHPRHFFRVQAVKVPRRF